MALRDVEVMVVGDVVKVFFARTFVWGDVDPHGDGLGAGESDGGAIVVEVRAPALFVCLGGGFILEPPTYFNYGSCLAVG